MAENQRSTDQSSERQLGVADVQDPPQAPLPRLTSVRHLYLVSNSETLQEVNTEPRAPAPRQDAPAGLGGVNGMLDRSIQVQIGRMLRDVFADVAEEAVPDRFVRLLEALAAKEKQR